VEQNEDAVVNAYDTFLTGYAAKLVETCKTSDPWTILRNLANRWKQKAVQSEQNAKQQAITQAVTQAERNLNTQKQSELNLYVTDKAWWKSCAFQLNQAVRKYDEALRYVWSTADIPVCPFHAHVLLICWEQEGTRGYLRSKLWNIDANGTLSTPGGFDDSYFAN
jgi:hypothetical protein